MNMVFVDEPPGGVDLQYWAILSRNNPSVRTIKFHSTDELDPCHNQECSVLFNRCFVDIC